MLIIDGEKILNEGNTVVTIGKFDGLHRGHMEIIDKMLENKGTGLVVSFVNHPSKLLTSSFSGNLISETEKIELLMEKSIDNYCPLIFDEKLRDTEAEDFFYGYIIGKWHCSCLVVGDDFCFGKGRKGNTEFLSEYCEKEGIRLIVVPRREYLGEPISSSRIRTALAEGRIEEANEMLGRDYSIKGLVARGNMLGRSIGFPTLNIYPPASKFLPKFGVYGSSCILNGRRYRSISNIGIKPTIEGKRNPLVETNLYDFDEDVYDSFAEIRLESFLRPEKRFENLDELKKQIEKDKKSWTKQ